MMKSLDHLVLTTRNAAKCIDFYTRVLGMELESFGQGRRALRFGEQKINLHDQNTVTDGYAAYPTPGSLDICLEPRSRNHRPRFFRDYLSRHA